MLVSRESSWEPAIDGWVATLIAAGRPGTTVGLRRYHLRRLATEQPRGPAGIRGEDLVEWAAGHEWARETRRSYRSSLRSFFRWTVHVGIRTDDPSQSLGIVRPTDPNPHPAPRRAIEQALNRAGPRERLAIRLAAEAGLRRGEVVLIHLDDAVEDLLGWSLIVHGKGGKERTVPLGDGLAVAVRDACTAGGGYAFPGQIDGHLSAHALGTTVSRLLPEGVTMHSLRHTFATTCYRATGDLLAVQQLLGHSSVATTQRYVLLDPGRLRAVAATAA